MDLEVAFLGTAGSMPTARRAHGILLRRGGERLLFDCGEGTQRQLMRSDVGLAELREILLTHYHADHYLGLPGMLKTFALRGRSCPSRSTAPSGFATSRRPPPDLRTADVPRRAQELRPGDRLERDDYRIEAFAVDHRVTAVGYALVEAPRPGRFDVDAARALGVAEGPLLGRLQAGEPVELDRETVSRNRSWDHGGRVGRSSSPGTRGRPAR